MRIMEIVSGTAVNGAIVTCVETTRALIELGHEVTLVCRPDAWVAEQLEGELDIVYSDLHRWPTDELRRIATMVREKRIDVLHTHMSRANFFGVLLRRFWKIPCVATANNRYIQGHWMFNDYVMAASEATRKFHRRYNLVPARKIDVVHNFIDDRRFHATAADKGIALRDELGIECDSILIGAVGDILERKGLIYLVRALPEIRDAVPNVHLVSVGYPEQPYAGNVREEARRLGVENHITWAGYQSDVTAVMSALDVMTLPTLEDNLPLSILEAMASSIPIVATDVGGIPECVVDGETGYLVPPADTKQLATALIKLLTNEHHRRELGNQGRKFVSRHFSRKSQMAKLEQVLEKVAA